MNQTLTKIKNLFKRLLGRIPSRLPVGVTEFAKFVDELQAIYDLPTKNKDDVMFAVTSTILRLGPTDSKLSKQYFVNIVKAGAAKQIAAHYFQEIKQRQFEAQKASQAALAVVPAQPAESGPKQ